MKLQTQVPLIKANNQIDYNSQLLLLGSCFVENIGERLSYFKFQSVQNPFGILFHPLALENLISRALLNKEYQEEDIFYLNERWQCFDAHSDLSATDKEVVLLNLNKGLAVSKNKLQQASHIIITMGTAWVYETLKNDQVVANCHKVPQKEFVKKLLPVVDILRSLENMMMQIRAVNKNVQFIFTVSPVRHLKDGFVENQQSKAHLISAIHELLQHDNALYFPSYELMMDELRDYRFYAEDMVHPNNLAIEYIWEKFKAVYISEESYSTMKEVEIIQKGLSHRPFNTDSVQHQNFLNNNQRKIEYLQNSYPFMKF